MMRMCAKSVVTASFLAAGIGLALMGPAMADPPPAPAPAGDVAACVAGLQPLALRIYNAVKPTLKPGDDLRSAIRSVVKPWVMNGDITRDQARPAAQAAGRCLKMGM